MAKNGGVHIAVDALGAKHSGTAMVLLDVLRSMLANKSVEKITLYCAPRAERSFDLPESSKLEDRPQPRYEASLPLRIFWNTHHLAARAKQDGADLVVSMGGTMQPHREMPHVSFVQQSLPFCPEALATLPLRQQLRMHGIGALTRTSCRGSRRVYVQTATMRAWVSDAFGINISHCETVLPEPRPLFIDEKTPPLLESMERIPQGARILYVGNSEPYKNTDLLIQSLPILRAQIPRATLFATWSPDHPACRRGDVVSLGYLQGGALGKAYALADVLIQPSLVETASLPVTEAMALGTPVLVADRYYARDICENAALFFDPRDALHCAEQLRRLLSDRALRTRLVEAGTRLVQRRMSQRPFQTMIESILEVASV